MKKQYASAQAGIAGRLSFVHVCPRRGIVKKQTSKSLKLSLALSMVGFLFMIGFPSLLHAQIVTNTYPQNRFYTMPAGYASAGTSEDVVTNCDMLEDPQGEIKAAAWSMANTPSLGYPANNMCQFMVEDYNGNMVIQDINTSGVSGAFQPDIVLANSPDTMGMPGYQVLVVYVVAPNSSSSVGTAYLDIYDVTNVGTPSIGLSFRTQRTLSTSCNGYPHIDMWSDASNLTNGLPTMSDFAVVWAENSISSNGNLTGWFGSVNNPGTTSTPLPSLASQYTNVFMPDVACVTSVDEQRHPVKQIELTYGNGVNDITIRTGGSGVIHTEMQEPLSGSAWAVTAGPTPLASFSSFAPRIEAMSQHSGATNIVKWQVAVTNYPSGGVWGYNNLTSAWLSNYAYTPPFSNPPIGFLHFQGACVAAGVGPSVSVTNIGNNQYTAGYYPWGTFWNYSRDISRLTGNIMSLAPYVINDSNQHVSYYWDVNQSLSLSNCSNSGKDLLAVWPDTFGIVYKHSTSNASTVWRMIKPATTQARQGIYPNPAAGWIRLADNEALDGYSICDATGRIVRKGSSLAAGEAINLNGLASGFYMLHAARTDGSASTYKFTVK